MRTTILLTILALAGCTPKPQVGPSAPAPAPAAAMALTPGASESLEPEGDFEHGPNPVSWKTADGKQAIAGLAFDMNAGTVRLLGQVEGGEQVELGKQELNSAYSARYAGVVQPDGTVQFVLASSGGSGDPGFTQGWQLSYDGQALKVDKAESKSGDEDRPAWMEQVLDSISATPAR